MNENTGAALAVRRSFLARIGAVLGGAGVGFLAGADRTVHAREKTFQPARHPQDDWMDSLSGKHRLIFDTTDAHGMADALLYVNNFLNATKDTYKLTDADSAVIIVARHLSTGFGFNDTIWAKYGVPLAARMNVTDPKTSQAPRVNLRNVPSEGGVTIDALVARGVHFAVCQMATRFMAGEIAKAAGGTADSVYTELTSGLIGHAHMVPAGIVAVNRGQERGYTLTTVA